jgi:hypothetical protein
VTGRDEVRIALHMRNLRIIAAAMMAGVVIFGGVVPILLASPDFEPPVESLPPDLPAILIMSAIALLIAAPFIGRATASRPAHDLDSALQRHNNQVIVPLAMRELAGILGIMVALLAGQIVWGYLVAGGALLLMGSAWPRAEDIVLP